MRVSINWLRDYVDIPVSPEELAGELTMAGVEVSKVEALTDNMPGVLVGSVLKVEPHPSADKLSLCTVEAGEKTATIVCGALNVRDGLKVAVALPGARLPSGMKIKSRKIRGVLSEGMICSPDELALSTEAESILELADDAPVGLPLTSYLGSEDTVLELDLTPNRPDCLSHIGIAREVRALFNVPLTIQKTSLNEDTEHTAEAATIEIRDNENCPRYTARIVKGVRIGPSSSLVQRRLRAVGLRPINNVVDAANYVLMDIGHPIHTFDYDRLEGHSIVVRCGRGGEEVVTLDGDRITVDESVLLICDAKKPVAIAGIVGLRNSEVTAETTNVLIESAYFNPMSIRRSAKKLGLPTDASRRFERGADPNILSEALHRVAELIVKEAGGTILKGVIDVSARAFSPEEITLRRDRLAALLGTGIQSKEIRRILKALGFDVVAEKNRKFRVKVPTFRPDVTREVDIIEEIARIFGYDNVQSDPRRPILLDTPANSLEDFTSRLKQILLKLSFTEVYTNSLLEESISSLTSRPGAAVPVQNPISSALSRLRTSLLPGLLETVAYNKNRQRHDLRLFEEGIVFERSEDAPTGVKETQHVAGVTAGETSPIQWNRPPNPTDFFDMKGAVEMLSKCLGTPPLKYRRMANPLYQMAQAVFADGEELGCIALVQPNITETFDIDDPVYYFELEVSALMTASSQSIRFRPPPLYPTVDRDICLVVPEKVPAEEVADVIVRNGGKLLCSSSLLDVYHGAPLHEGTKSLTYRLRFQSDTRTLRESDVDKLFEAIVQAAAVEVGGSLRKTTVEN